MWTLDPGSAEGEGAAAEEAVGVGPPGGSVAPTGPASAASQRTTTAATPKRMRPRERCECRNATIPYPVSGEFWARSPVPASIVGRGVRINGTGVRLQVPRWHQSTGDLSVLVPPRTAHFAPRGTPMGDWAGGTASAIIQAC